MAYNLVAFILAVTLSCADSAKHFYGYSECSYRNYTTRCPVLGQKLHQTNKQLQSFPSLKYKETCLRLGNNLIQAFPNDLLPYQTLETLDLIQNRISKLPENLIVLEKLETLDVRENKITAIASTIRFPGSLRALMLAGNGLKSFPDGISIPNLFVLDLSRNLFNEIPKSFCVSKQLIRVDFTNNPLRTDLSKYTDNLNACPNANGVPFCLFSDSETLRCDCKSLYSILGVEPAFQFGTKLRNHLITCSEDDSEEEYKGWELFNINATALPHSCHEALKTQQSKSAASNANVALVFVGMFFGVHKSFERA
ncbi:leucine-rich repeat-containing protein 28-like [Dreissena polymorpha]|uniref:Uncharacterized protein n=1 Tax=Dreissena polymorpha TaxID=45954 RepID=A0A9D4RQR9_DREPO|nr:leucine-rich repeat-containing protein 28-like [Dreissena polymorpha]KAH3878041.1 hypothetical protein DPMN_001921 [Dreissena polymorpha]